MACRLGTSVPVSYWILFSFTLGFILNRNQANACMGSPADRAQEFKNYMGGSTDVFELPDQRNGNQICQPEDTYCDFAGDKSTTKCRWGDSKPTDNHWWRVTGRPDPGNWAGGTGTTQMPDGDYAAVPVIAGQNSDPLLSDPIAYQHDSEASVMFDYWLTQGAQIKVCAVSTDSSLTPYACDVPITRSSSPPSPGPYVARIQGPINKPFRLAIIPQSASSTPGFVIIDNLGYVAKDICPSAITTTTTAPTTVAPGVGPRFGCGPINPWADHRQGTVDTSDYLHCQPDPSSIDGSSSDSCRWGSDGPGATPWELVNCSPDPNDWQSQTGTSTVPDGPFFAEDLNGRDTPDWFMSDPMDCMPDQQGTVSFSYWTTSTASFKVCAVDSQRKIISGTCSSQFTQKGSPGPASQPIPGPINQPFTIAFIPQGKGFVAIQNINVQATSCRDATPATTPAPIVIPVIPCNELQCDVESGTPCQFNPQGAGSSQPLVVSDGRSPLIGCADNGLVRPDTQSGRYFLGQNISYGHNVVLESPDFAPTSNAVTLSMRIFSSMYGGQVSVCTKFTGGSSFAGCQVVTGTADFSANNRYWMTKSVTLDPGTTKIYIVGEMVYQLNVCNGLAIDNLAISPGCSKN